MRAWVPRAAGMAVVHAAGQVAMAIVQSRRPGSDAVVTGAVLGMVVGAGVLWSAMDGWRRRPEPAQTWLIVGFVTGVLAGPLAVLAQAVLVDSTGLEALAESLVGGAFTALLVLGSAALGVPIGRLLTPGSFAPFAPIAPEPASAGQGRSPAHRGQRSPQPRAR